MQKLGLPIGRISSFNVLFNLEENSFVFNDIIDINHTVYPECEYYPDHIDNPTSEQCQNFAIMKLVCDILDFEIGKDSTDFRWISEAVKLELEENEYPLGDLNRLLDSIETAQGNSDTPTIRVPVPDKFNELTIYGDNKRVYVSLEKGRNAKDIVVKMQGIGGSIQFILDPESKSIKFITGVRESDVVPHYIVDQAVLEINVALDVQHAVGRSDYSDLSNFLFGLEEFVTAIDDVLASQLNDQEESVDSQILRGLEQNINPDVPLILDQYSNDLTDEVKNLAAILQEISQKVSNIETNGIKPRDVDAQVIQAIKDLKHYAAFFEQATFQMETKLLKTSISIAQKIISIEVGENSSKIAKQTITHLLQKVKTASKVQIHLNPKDYQVLKDQLNLDPLIELRQDPNVTAGGVVIASDLGNFDGNIESKVTSMLETLDTVI